VCLHRAGQSIHTLIFVAGNAYCITGFRRSVNETCALLGFYTVQNCISY